MPCQLLLTFLVQNQKLKIGMAVDNKMRKAFLSVALFFAVKKQLQNARTRPIPFLFSRIAPLDFPGFNVKRNQSFDSSSVPP